MTIALACIGGGRIGASGARSWRAGRCFESSDCPAVSKCREIVAGEHRHFVVVGPFENGRDARIVVRGTSLY